MVQNIKVCLVLIFSILFVVYMIYISSSNPQVYEFMDFNEKNLETDNFPEVANSDFDMTDNNLPWYFKGGTIRPLPSDRRDIWPEETSLGDRLLNQLMYVPTNISSKIKKVWVQEDIKTYPKLKIGNDFFFNCPVNKCVIVSDQLIADAVIHKRSVQQIRDSSVPPEQIWIVYASENPFNSGKSRFVNWTASYRSDSDIVLPYGKWLYYNESVITKPQRKNYAEGKTKKVAWFVSNCSPQNDRNKYAKELKKYIEVDVYGSCGDKKCPRSSGEKCMEMLAKQYKFYLSFENGNCREYITEKFFQNALEHDILPIVMGAHPDDYKKVAPYNSYIHVDQFPTPKHLADYLNKLDENDTLYNSYFQWKGTGELMDCLYFFCRLCAMLHSNRPPKSYENFMDWWNPPGMCQEGPYHQAGLYQKW